MNHGGFNASTFPLGDTKILPDYKNLKTLDEIDNMTTSLIDGSHSPAKDAVGNPFYFRIHLSRSDKIKVVLMSVFVVPIRIVLIVIFLFLTWLGCYLGQLGLSPQRLQDQPIMGFRRLLQTLSRELVLMSVRSAGFSMRTVGRHASVQEAPILVAAPHSSFFRHGGGHAWLPTAVCGGALQEQGPVLPVHHPELHSASLCEAQ